MSAHLFKPEACPNFPHGFRGQRAPKGTCPLCGRNPRAFILGERLAAVAVVTVLAASGLLISWAIIGLVLWIASW